MPHRFIKTILPPNLIRMVKRACDFALHVECNFVQRFFNAIKHYLCVATTYEERAPLLCGTVPGLQTRWARIASRPGYGVTAPAE
jgi:hypothetical protein